MAKRRKPGRRKPWTGYASQAKNGTWGAFFPKPGGGHHVRKGFDTKQDAEAWLDSLVKQRDDKGDVKGGQQRVSAWVDTWATRAAKERGWKVKMVADVQWKLGYIKPYIGDMAVVDVLPDHVDLIWDDLRKNLAETTVRQIRNYLFQVFEEARQRRYITYNPVLKPARHKRAKQKEPQRLSAPQAAILVRAAEPSFYALAWWLILVFGLRAGEVCGLRWGDVDLETAVLTVAQEYTDVRGTATQDKPKGDKTRRLPIPRALIPLFRLHLRALTKRAAQGVARDTWKEHGLVFPGRSGKPMNPTSLRHQLTKLTETTRLPPVTTHMLRHTAAKFYTDSGCPHELTAAILGHTTGITGHYGPPDVETLRPWAEKVYRGLVGEVERERSRQIGA
jgi:integrase